MQSVDEDKPVMLLVLDRPRAAAPDSGVSPGLLLLAGVVLGLAIAVVVTETVPESRPARSSTT